MIFEVLQVITEEVNSYFEGSPVSLENIATIDSETGDNPNTTPDIVLSLLNLKEEFTLKNQPNYHINGTEVTYKNPKLNLNIFILFSGTNTTYTEALKGISKVLEFFQGKKVFTQDNTIYNRDEEGMENLTNFKFIVDLYTPSFEEMNFIWGTLGGKQYPSALYKVTLLEIERDLILEKGTVITGLNSGLNNQ
ncbi:MAG: DUF4255 domain-containing protein [Flavobacteriaceae bacterium]|nr:DUF4255 domain-containing protein [Flavobacteriaceae bacterium]